MGPSEAVSPQVAVENYLRDVERSIPLTGFASEADFNQFCGHAIELWRRAGIKNSPPKGAEFESRLSHIRTTPTDSSNPQVIPTNWGGVDITFRQDPKVEKFLVVEGGKWLAYEKHELKEEALEGREGYALLLLVDSPGARPRPYLVQPGSNFEIKPQHEHCLIALTNSLVFERSKDHKGMDKDLIFLFMPKYS